MFPDGEQELFVEDFESHLKLMQGFHERYMGGNAVLKHWLSKVTALEIDMITPQHGSVFGKEAAKKFFAWLRELKCGTDLAEALYT